MNRDLLTLVQRDLNRRAMGFGQGTPFHLAFFRTLRRMPSKRSTPIAMRHKWSLMQVTARGRMPKWTAEMALQGHAWRARPNAESGDSP